MTVLLWVLLFMMTWSIVSVFLALGIGGSIKARNRQAPDDKEDARDDRG